MYFHVDFNKWLDLLLPSQYEENAKRFAATAPAIDTPAIDEPPSQEADLAVKSPKAQRAPVKKVVATRGSTRVKKWTNTGASLEAHRSTSSSDDVRVATGLFASICRDFHTHVFFLDRN
jgi:hypothetical protein